MSAEGTARAVKLWSSFQCTGIHHIVRARTYDGDENLAYALNKSVAPLPFFKSKQPSKIIEIINYRLPGNKYGFPGQN